MNYPNLFKPISIGNKVIKNRLFMPPLSCNLANKGYITDALVEHYTNRAKGGVGLIVTEVTTVEPVYTYLPGDISICDDSYIEGWKKLVDSVHQYGCVILSQLFHPAFMAFPLPGTPRLIAPSNVGPYYAKEAPREVTVEELKVIIGQFGDAARRVQIAGGDGVEIQCAHAHGLLGGFLTPLYNKRTDEYGGDLDSRLRLTLEVIEDIRNKCGKDFIIDVRISGDEYSDGGLTVNDQIYVCKKLEAAGVDFIHVSGGNTIKRGSSMPAPGTKPAPHIEAAETIRKYVNIPITTVSRINEPWVAEELIANDRVDAVMVGRANICDSDFANKALSDEAQDIRPCIGCGRCLTSVMFGKPISCTVNPNVQSNYIEPAKNKKKCLVIGGGPSGMEAAYVLSARGHQVILMEKSNKLGGQLNVAAVPIGKNDLCKVVKFMINRLKKTNVEIRLNSEVTKEMLDQEFKDYVVLGTTGATAKEVEAFKAFGNTMTADDVLSGKKFPGKKIIIVGGGSVGCETADYLAPLINDLFPANRDITLLEMSNQLMMGEGGAAKSMVTRRMMEKGVHILLNSKVKEVKENTVIYENNFKDHELTGDTLIFALDYNPNPILDERIIQLGDANKVGNLKDAISSAYELAKTI